MRPRRLQYINARFVIAGFLLLLDELVEFLGRTSVPSPVVGGKTATAISAKYEKHRLAERYRPTFTTLKPINTYIIKPIFLVACPLLQYTFGNDVETETVWRKAQEVYRIGQVV